MAGFSDDFKSYEDLLNGIYNDTEPIHYSDYDTNDSLLNTAPSEGIPPQIGESSSERASLWAPGIQNRRLSPHDILYKYWGYKEFRPLQLDIIQSVLNNQDTLGLMPTGGGKSITFQVPALIMKGVCIVVTPLISLMKDQVDHLKELDIKAEAIHSGMTRDRIVRILDNAAFGMYKFLYVSPERLESKLFKAKLQYMKIGLIVVDECHCISQWGFDFRPSYLNIVNLRDEFPETPILALTATATPGVADDICKILEFREGYKVFRKSFYRDNIGYVVRPCQDKEQMMVHILKTMPGSAIVYCRNRDKTKQLSMLLNEQGITADYYHAGITFTEKTFKQNSWMKGDTRVIVATNAFGMGIDKPDVRTVIHYQMPSTLEEYFQEAGRAGRDGNLSYAVVLVDKKDEGILSRRAKDEFPDKAFCREVYENVCNYLCIGEGEGFEHSYRFDEELFCIRFHMHPIRTHSALAILELSGIWTLIEQDSNSRITILVQRDQLYHYKSDSNSADEELLINTLLRSYEGIFINFVMINEVELAAKTSLSSQRVYDLLIELDRRNIVHYIPQENTPKLLMNIRREDSRYIRIPKSAFEDRKERFNERIRGVIDYIKKDNECRSRILVRYFGEELKKTCNKCDVCLKKNKSGILHWHYTVTEEALEELSKKERSITVSDLQKLTNVPDEYLTEVIHDLSFNDPAWIIEGDEIIFKKKD